MHFWLVSKRILYIPLELFVVDECKGCVLNGTLAGWLNTSQAKQVGDSGKGGWNGVSLCHLITHD